MKVESLKHKRDFDRVFAKKNSFGNRHFTMLYVENGLPANRIGIIVSKKISKSAVHRNKIRRQTKEIFRLMQDSLKTGYDIIIIPKRRCLEASYADMAKSFQHLFLKQSMLK